MSVFPNGIASRQLMASSSAAAPVLNSAHSIVQARPPPIWFQAPVTQQKSDLSMLESGAFSDFTVVCGDKEWKTHKAILSRCPYFQRAFAEDTCFIESVQSRINIEGFEEFEISWLLYYIYAGSLQFFKADPKNISTQRLEIAVLLWGIGDYFCLNDLAQRAANLGTARCTELIIRGKRVSSVINGPDYLPEVEAAIREAWRQDRASGPLQKALVEVCVHAAPFLANIESFSTLLDDVPEFSSRFAKALVGYQKENTNVRQWMLHSITCYQCHRVIPPITSQDIPQELFYETASLQFFDHLGFYYCSRDCFNAGKPDMYHYK